MTDDSNVENVLKNLDALYRAKRQYFLLGSKKIILDAHASIIKKSPVDTGRFRASNFLLAGENTEPPTVTFSNEEYLAHLAAKIDNESGPPLPSMASAANERVAEAIALINSSLNFNSEGEAVFIIINNLPYAIPLEEGHSDQAPNGVYRIAMMEARRTSNALRRGLDAIQ